MKTVIDAVNEFKGEWSSSTGTCLWYYSGNEKYIFGNSSHSFNTVCTREEFNQCVKEMSNLVKPPKPIYTQAMRDSKQLPSIGVFCMVAYEDCHYYECEIIAHKQLQLSDEMCMVAVYLIKNHKGETYFYSHCPFGSFKPLTPPKTAKEILINEFENALHDVIGTHTDDNWSAIEDMTTELFDKFNIQLLEVKI